ncbi:hypothetical protein [Actinoplanes sp. NPDC051411]|uniref:nSTAND1 domain-containing NTPase n=1 Tax=Actinoplanes sp. NPDC051411 TaxID=3155522 RepID=UPI003438717D
MDQVEVADPAEIRTRGDFARELTVLRTQAGLTVRQVSAKAEAFGAHSTIGDWFAGRGLPSGSSQELFVRVLSACGAGEESSIGTWLDALNRVRRVTKRHGRGPAPYRGLASFQLEHAGWFFGRRALAERLTRQLAELRDTGGGIQLVIGASGAGKSSLLRAGVMAVDREGPLSDCEMRLMTPGARPLHELTKTTEDLPPRALLIVDQFEEAFTACPDPDERRAFVTALALLADGPAGAVVVLGLRADFYAQALGEPALYEPLAERSFTVGPMADRELREAIVEPARAAGVDLEDGLVELLLRDAVSRRAESTGVLPLLSHALFATWSHGDGHRMTINDYREIGGLDQAVAATADTVLAGLTETQRDDARRLFLNLVRVSTDTADTRRRMSRDRLIEAVDATRSLEVSEILDRFVVDRLITVDDEGVQISHEALLAAWPTLCGWLAADRDGLLLEQRLSEAAADWRAASHDRGLLYRGLRLTTAQQWAESRSAALPSPAREFLETSIRHDHRRVRRLVQVFAALLVLVLTSALLAAYAFDQRTVVTGQRREAVDQRNQAISQLVATRADRLRSSDPSLAYQLSLAAYRTSPTVEARSSLLSSSVGPQVARLLGAGSPVQALAYRSDHRVLAAASVDGRVRLWDSSDPNVSPVPLGGPLTGATGDLYGLAFSSDGRLLAAAGADRRVYLWDTADPRHPNVLPVPLAGPASTVYAVTFDPSGHVLAAAAADGKIWRWDLTDPHRPHRLTSLTGFTGAVQAVTFAPDGRRLAAGGADGTVRLWRTTAPGSAQPVATIRAGQFKVYAVAFSPDGSTLAAGGGDKIIRLWQVTGTSAPRPEPAAFTGPTSWINAIQFSPDGRSIAAGSSDKRATVWDLRTGRVTDTLPVPSPVTALTYGTDAQTIIAAATDGAVRIWHLRGPLLAGHSDAVFNAVYMPGPSAILATASRDQTVRLWNVTDRRRPQPLGVPLHRAGLSASIALSPDGHTLAAGTRTGQVDLWNISDLRHPSQQPVPLTGSAALVESVAFSPDGQLLAAGSDDGTVRVWNLATAAATPVATVAADDASMILFVTFSPDSRTLVSTTTAGTASLWDVTDPDRPSALGPPLGGFSGYAYSAAFSPDGKTLAVSSADRTTRLWNLGDPHRPRALGPALTGPASYAYWATFSPDGRSLAVASTDDAVWIWNVADPSRPTPWATLTGATDALYTAQYSPDGRTLAAAGAAATTLLWDTDVDRVSGWVCATSGDWITAAEWHQYVPGVPYTPPCAPARKTPG